MLFYARIGQHNCHHNSLHQLNIHTNFTLGNDVLVPFCVSFVITLTPPSFLIQDLLAGDREIPNQLPVTIYNVTLRLNQLFNEYLYLASLFLSHSLFLPFPFPFISSSLVLLLYLMHLTLYPVCQF